MIPKQKVPYGLWSSPVSPETLSHSLRLEDISWCRTGETLVWLERRAGRGVLVARHDRDLCDRDLTEEHQVGARVGYGGGSFSVGRNDVYYVEKDGRVYRQSLSGGLPEAVTPAFGRAASPTPSADERHMAYVHHHAGHDSLALCATEGGQWPTRLAQGADFYMQPTWHPDGSHIAWVEWDHPHMPWDSARLIVADLTFDGVHCTAKSSRQVAGGDDCSVFQPTFSPDGKLLAFISDAVQWSHIHVLNLETGDTTQLTTGEKEYDQPAWLQGMRTFAFSRCSGYIYAIENKDARHSLVRITVDNGESEALRCFSGYGELTAPSVNPKGRVALIGSASTRSPRVITGATSAPEATVLKRSTAERVASSDLVTPQSVQFLTTNGSHVHGLLYQPKSDGASLSDGLPPAVISMHGGPTGQALSGYSPRAQFFATRGYVYLDVNYRGSSGYGKSYRRSLDGQWGVYDVDDAVAAARYLASARIADVGRIVIVGGSAGGFTVLKTLADHPGVFAAGLCLYGVANLLTLAAETHKFEAHYLDSLLGPLPAASTLYRERSPIFLADRIADPVAIFQGSEDNVVPPSQAEEIVDSLRRRGVAFEYHLYEGEEHGWRLPQTIKRHYRDMEQFLRHHVLFK